LFVGLILLDRRRGRGYLEEGGALQDAGGAAHLSDGVHGELRRSDVRHGDAEAGGEDGPDGGPTGGVVTHHHVLREERSKVTLTTKEKTFISMLSELMLIMVNISNP